MAYSSCLCCLIILKCLIVYSSGSNSEKDAVLDRFVPVDLIKLNHGKDPNKRDLVLYTTIDAGLDSSNIDAGGDPEKRKLLDPKELGTEDGGLESNIDAGGDPNKVNLLDSKEVGLPKKLKDKANLHDDEDDFSAGSVYSSSTEEDMVDSSAIPGYEFNSKEKQKFKIWPRGVVSYFIDDFSYDKVLRDKIRKFLNQAATLTGLHFVELAEPPDERVDNKRYMFFINRRSQLNCTDYNDHMFTLQGVQRMVLGYDCINDGYLASVLLTVLAVPPQHNSPDRGSYIQVRMNNVLTDKQHLFTAVKDQDWLFHNLPYDYDSAGHYDIYKYTANGGQTIVPLEKEKVIREAVTGLSELDVRKIRLMYNNILRNVPLKALSACHKLYKPGPKFNDRQIKLNSVTLKPSAKPVKYLTNNEIVNQDQDKEIVNQDEEDGYYDDDGNDDNNNDNDNNDDDDSDDGDNGDGDNGDGDNGDGDNGDEDNDYGDDGDEDNGDTDNDYGDDGDEDNGDTDNDYGDNGDGENDGDDNDDSNMAVLLRVKNKSKLRKTPILSNVRNGSTASKKLKKGKKLKGLKKKLKGQKSGNHSIVRKHPKTRKHPKLKRSKVVKGINRTRKGRLPSKNRI